jgi:hypothetical protein
MQDVASTVINEHLIGDSMPFIHMKDKQADVLSHGGSFNLCLRDAGSYANVVRSFDL